jgi:hypothetical protein
MSHEKDRTSANGYPWINPIGGFGDMLMLSGVLKHVVDHDSSQRYNLIRRTNYLAFLKDHPAIAEIGHPPKGAVMARVDYWSMETLGPRESRPYQVLARGFGLPTPIEETLYLPKGLEDDSLLHNIIPWKKLNVAIAPSSDSPRKMMHPQIWHRLVDYLLADGAFVLQVGRLRDQHIRNTYSILGLTTPHQLIVLLNKCDLVITVDNFVMHAAHLVDANAVALWGATNNEIYGYPEQTHLQTPKSCGLDPYDDCIGPARNDGGVLYGTPCPEGEMHCLNRITPEEIYEVIKKALLKSRV